MNNKKVILIVDDQPINLSMLSQILSNKYLVRVANSGKRALKVVNTSPQPDLILLDITRYYDARHGWLCCFIGPKKTVHRHNVFLLFL